MSGNGPHGISVVHVITRLDRGGSSGVVLDLARIQAERGFRVTVLTGPAADPQEDLTAYQARSGVSIIFASSLIRAVRPVSDFRAFGEIRRCIRSLRPDLVHTHTSKAGILGRLGAYAAGVRPLVHTPHGHIFYGYFHPWKTRCFILAERAAARITSRIVTLTVQGRKDHLREGIGSPDQYRVVPSGIDTRRYASADRACVRLETGWSNAPVVGWAGRLTAVKNCAGFLRAAAMVSRVRNTVRFLVAGEGEERGMLERLAAGLGLGDRVRFLGDRRDMPEVFAAMDVFVLSSRNEGFGRVLAEAMASGVPVISTAVGGAAEVLGNGETGILVQPDCPDALAEAIMRLLNDADARKRLRDRGLRRVAEFDIGVTAEEYERVYREVLDR